MRGKRHRPEEIVAKLRQVDGLVGQGQTRGRGPLNRRDPDQLRDELLRGEIFYSLQEAQVLIEAWQRHDTTQRPHAVLGSGPPVSAVARWPAVQPRPAPPATPAVQTGTIH